jgi:hypothetical protein
MTLVFLEFRELELRAENVLGFGDLSDIIMQEF